MTQRDDVQKFEQGRIRALQEERLHIQKKTFTKWMNSFLQKARMEVDDLFVDLADGKKLLKLLEIISGEKLAKPNNGRMRVHKIENVNKSLAFLHTKVRLESIGAEDIVDGNPRLILGLIWTIILRFQIQEIEIDVDEENESSEKKSAKDALLLWVQRKTHGYQGVNIQDFTVSWRTGLGFNALIHSHRPDLFDYSELVPHKHIDNLNHAFEVANNELGIQPLLDAEDVDTNRPDEKSIITYVASYYHTFARMKNEEKSGRRIAKIIGQMVEADKMKDIYDRLITDLLEWIRMKVVELENRNFPNSLEGIQSLLLNFGYYRTQEKPPKYKERSEIEALYFQINTQLKELRQPAFTPRDGQLIQDIERSWETLEHSEHNREVALRQELLRQERLEQLNYKFERKSVLREGYLKEMIQVLSDPRYGSNLGQVDATVKKHEAISADILAREERFHDLTQMCEELVKENYRGAERVKAREAEVMAKWKELLLLLEKHKQNLSLMGNVMSVLRDIESTLVSIQALNVEMASTDVGVHLQGVEELLQKHALQELQVAALGEHARKLKRLGDQAISQTPKEEAMLRNKLVELDKALKDLQENSNRRKNILEDARNLFQFLQDQEDEEAWLIEKQRICQADIAVKDLRAVLSLQQKHKALVDEIKSRKGKSDHIMNAGKQLVIEQHPKAGEIQQKIESIDQHWKQLDKLAADKTKRLQDAAAAYQFYADANEADSWLNEKTSLLASKDYGSDEPSAQALLQRHKDLQGELNAYKGDIQNLNTQAEKLIASGVSMLEPAEEAERQTAAPVELDDEWTTETRLVPTEVWEEIPAEKIEHKTKLEERSVPQVKALYPFEGQGMLMAKGEVMYLLNKTNPDWWSVRKADGSDGFVPANYVREIEPRLIQIQVRKPEKVVVMQKVKKTKMVKQQVPVKLQKAKQQQSPTKRKADDSNSVVKRQKRINDTYNELQEMAARRHALLEDAIRLFGFYKECDDFEKWIKEKERLLQTDDSTEPVEVAKRKFEKFLTDLSASNKRIESLDAEVDEFEKQKHSQIDKVRSRHRQIHNLWDHLNRLKNKKERSLEGASSVELFQRTCEEAKDWMLEKMTQLDTAELGPDLKTVQALQRRHQHLERELAPVEEKVKRVNLLANDVKNSYPLEKDNVAERQKEIQSLWQKVKDKACERRNRLENAVGQQIFTNSCKALLTWVADVKEQLNAETSARDVETAQMLLKNHADLGQDIVAHKDEFAEVTDLGRKLLKSNPKLTEVNELVDRLSAEQEAVDRGWAEKQHWLEQCLQLQMFNKESDKIDAATSSHQAFLQNSNLGDSLDQVEALLKQHRAFVNTLVAQEERLAAYSNRADALIQDEHYDSPHIDERRKAVLTRRQEVKEAAQNRTHALEASKYYQEFNAEVDDLRSWLNDKLKTASDQNYRDLSNLERKLQKHEAFERELRANEGQLRTVNKMGQALIAQDNYRRQDVAQTLKELNEEWQKLVGISLDKGRRLRQALLQHGYNYDMEDARKKLDEIEAKLRSDHVGTDLRSCKDMQKKHESLESDLAQWRTKIDELVGQSEEMAQDGHFDSESIKKAAKDSQKRLKNLDGPMKKRREALIEALRFFKFGFELDTELQWIKEHMQLASSTTLGQNLHQAQILHKKHKKLEAEISGHRPVIDKTLDSGKTLIAEEHPEKEQVAKLCEKLEAAWSELTDAADERAQKLELSLKAQQFFFEANEVESWLNEKSGVLTSTDYGRDRDAVTKLLTKHKVLELELDTYNNIITEMGRGAQALIQSGHPESKAIDERQQTLEHQVRSCKRQAVLRQHRLMESLFRHEYFQESEQLERWIAEQYQQASSEDYGQDYEHLLLLQAKFDDFKHRVDAGSKRFKQCEDLAQKLIANDSPYVDDIEKKQQQLREVSEAVALVTERHEQIRKMWQTLLDQIDNREKRLAGAGEIHRFHRDVAEALSRIHEKSAALGTELGRDLNSALSLLRRQEAFENELVALEVQLQVLVDDASQLQAKYPSNKINIQQKQELVVTAWKGLQERAELRRDQLQASVDLQRFLSQARDLTGWASGLRASMMADIKVRSVAQAQALKVEHEALKGEIEAREENFRNAADLSAAMAQTGHYAAVDAEEKCVALFHEREKLYTAWQLRKIHLDQVIDLHCFLRDAKQLEDAANAQEAALQNPECGETVDEVANQVKKHDAFERKLATQDERLAILQECGDKLISQKHFESPYIGSRLADVQEKRLKVRQLCTAKRQQLDDALLHAQFIRDVTDARNWIAEKQKKLQAEIKMGSDVNDLEDKIKKLQKHQTLQAEVAANEGRMKEIRNKGMTLIAKRHKAAREIEKEQLDLDTAWRQLLQEVANRGKGLEEAQDILEFNSQLDKIDAWIRDKEMMIQAGDTGRDYEHCLALQRKLDDVDSDMRVDDTRIKNINALADKLVRQGRSGVQQRRDDFINKWRGLQGALGHYRDRLAGALEVHLFNREVADTLQRINEKSLAMDSDDLVERDLNGVQALQRKQEALEREMTAVERKLQEHDNEAQILCKKYPESSGLIQARVEELVQSWNDLLEVREKRRAALGDAYIRQKFLSDLADLEQWVGETVKRMEGQSGPTSVAEAEAQLEMHDERKAEIVGRKDAFKTLQKFGEALSKDNDPEILEAVDKLEKLQLNLNDAWEKHKNDLTHAYQVQIFKEQADILDGWLAAKEAFLNNDDIGESPSAVEALIKKHKDFEGMLNSQLNRVDEVEKFAQDILANEQYDNTAVTIRLNAILGRRDRLIDSTDLRTKKLKESQQLQQFRRNLYEVENWLSQKMQIAADENYRELSNLQSKIQKHAAFDAEILANSNRVYGMQVEGKDLIQADHFASAEIQQCLEELESDWKQLQDMSQLKKQRLQDAYQALLFDRSLDEFVMWLDEVEAQLQSPDYGKDLASASNFSKRHTALENDIQQHTENCESINETAEQFVKKDHFLAEELHEKAQDAITRFHLLASPCQARRDLIAQSVMLHQFTRDADDELSWLDEREPLAASTDYGNNLMAVQSLQKKHQALEAELQSREPVVAALVNRAKHLNSGNSLPEIAEISRKLQTKLPQVRDLASIRRLRLQDALESQTFYAEAIEAESWLKEKRPILASADIGRDEESAQSLQRKMEAVGCEVAAFQATVQRLENLAKNLIDRQHFDAANISIKYERIEKMFQELQHLLLEREKSLKEALSYFGFIRECEQVQEWMADQQAKAASEDYGTDVEHVELLTQAFETFLSSLNNSEQRVEACIESGQRLVADKSVHAQQVENKVKEIKEQWDDLMELAHARQDALAGAKQVHIFDRTADETILWIAEKAASLTADYYEQDLQSIQALVRKHAAFESELIAVKEQVDAVTTEARRLANLFPDAEEHVMVKHEDTLAAWEDLQEKAEQRKENLQQAEQIQAYFDQYQELMAWTSEMFAKITSPELAHDVAGAESLITKHNEYKSEIDSRQSTLTDFYVTGDKFIRDNHFLAPDIRDKINNLKQRVHLLHTTCEKRSIIYEQNLDTQLFLREASMLENWLFMREENLLDGKLGDSITQVEDLIKKHEDFEKTIEVQEEKFAQLKRTTLIEQAFWQQKQDEAEARRREEERQQQERLQQRKRAEMQRITDLRRQEDFSRQQQEQMNGGSGSGAAVMADSGNANGHTTSLTKSNSVAHMFQDRLKRRPSDGSSARPKRSESMKVGTKPIKQTPSFTTRRRVNSFRKAGELPPVEIQTFLERKQVCNPGGKKAANRTWKTYYTVLCGQLLCFFKNRDDFESSKALVAPVGIHNATCVIAYDYTKRKHTFRLTVVDGSEFLFACSNESELQEWVSKIDFRAKLPPSQQLLNFELTKDPHHEMEISSQSSRTSSPDVLDPVILRHEPHSFHYQQQQQQHQNGNSPQYRNSISGQSPPPPLPISDPPKVRLLDALGESNQGYGDAGLSRSEWSSTPSSNRDRPSSMQVPNDNKKSSSRIMDLFRKKRPPTTQM